MKKELFWGCLLSLGITSSVFASSGAMHGKVFIVEPRDGSEVTGPVTIKFGVENMEVVPAGTDKPNSGHHHLLVDTEEVPVAGAPIAKDERHLHFGKGQTETTLNLSPGKHTLRLVFGDKDHVPHHPMLASEKVTINVK